MNIININYLCACGKLDKLIELQQKKIIFEYDEHAINGASINGHVHILEWFKNSGYEFKYNEYAISWASYNGHIHILEWFKNSGYDFKYNEKAINWALEDEHIHILDWFKNNSYKTRSYYIKQYKH